MKSSGVADMDRIQPASTLAEIPRMLLPDSAGSSPRALVARAWSRATNKESNMAKKQKTEPAALAGVPVPTTPIGMRPKPK